METFEEFLANLKKFNCKSCGCKCIYQTSYNYDICTDCKIKALEKQLADKDKEIELLKHLGKHETATELFRENAKLIIEKNEFAIQELKKVKAKADIEYYKWKNDEYKGVRYDNYDIAAALAVIISGIIVQIHNIEENDKENN